MAALGKKKKAKDDERISALDNARKQHNYHIGRLEQMLRLLDNNDLAPDQVSWLIRGGCYADVRLIQAATILACTCYFWK